jgi:hypothetical protein
MQGCKKAIKCCGSMQDENMRFFIFQLHNKCATHLKPECDFGELREHILPPTAICPAVLVSRLFSLFLMNRELNGKFYIDLYGASCVGETEDCVEGKENRIGCCGSSSSRGQGHSVDFVHGQPTFRFSRRPVTGLSYSLFFSSLLE